MHEGKAALARIANEASVCEYYGPDDWFPNGISVYAMPLETGRCVATTDSRGLADLFSACHPAAIRSIAAYVAELESENAKLRQAASLGDAHLEC